MSDERRLYRPTKIRQWRKHRGYANQGALVDKVTELFPDVELTIPTLSRLESGRQGYTQERLEQLAAALECLPGDLIDRDPTVPSTTRVSSSAVADLELALSGVLTKLVSLERPIHEWPETLSAAVLTWLSRPDT